MQANRLLILAVIAWLSAGNVIVQAAEPPASNAETGANRAAESSRTGSGRPSLIDEREYKALRKRVRSRDAAIGPCVDMLRQRAEFLRNSPVAVVTDKRFTPHSPSKDRHDYVSVATYWWPNPDSANGLPYIRRDGHLSPDVGLYDRPRWEQTVGSIITLSRAAYFLDEPRYAEAAATRIRSWFLDPRTRMNPHLRFAQMIPGQCQGRQYGIIDFALYLPAVLDHVQLLAGRNESGWTAADQRSMRDWCDRFLKWAETHEFGRQEEAAANNHAVHYDRMVVCLALFLDRPERARAQLEKSRKRIGQQIGADGSMPHELRRTCSFGYTVMNTRGFVELAWMARSVNVDLWSYTGENGGSIPAAVDFLHRHVRSTEPWPYPQIEPIDWRMVWPVFQKVELLAQRRYDAEQLAHRMPADFQAAAFSLIEPIHPFGDQRSPALKGREEKTD